MTEPTKAWAVESGYAVSVDPCELYKRTDKTVDVRSLPYGRRGRRLLNDTFAVFTTQREACLHAASECRKKADENRRRASFLDSEAKKREADAAQWEAKAND